MNKINTFLKLLIYFFIIAGTLFAQVTQEWVASYNGPGDSNDVAQHLTVDGSGNVYVSGWSYGNGTYSDYATIKYNSSGVQQWIARYNGLGNSWDAVISHLVDGLGNVYVTGSSIGSGTEEDYTTIKYNSSGVQQWVQRYNGPGDSTDMAHALAIDGSGNVYVTGQSWGNTECDYATIKYNSAGVQQWVARYNGPENGEDYAYSLAVDGLGNVYVTGQSFGNPYCDYATVKYNSSGVQQWVAIYNYGDWDQAYYLAVDGSGNVYVTGISWGIVEYDYATIKYNSAGLQQWVSRYNGPNDGRDGPNAIATDGSGNVYVTGFSYMGSGTMYDYATIKYNSSGVQQWIALYNGPGDTNDIATSVKVDVSGNVYVTGISKGNGTGNDLATIKYNSSGLQQWVQRYNGPGNGSDGGYSLAIDSLGCVYVTGWGTMSGSPRDYVTIKYTQQIGIKNISSEVPDNFSLSQNYPNPFNPKTIINFQLPMSNDVKLIIYDVMGREVATLVNEQLNPGTYEVEWNAGNYPSGVYFYRLSTESFSETKKMILVK